MAKVVGSALACDVLEGAGGAAIICNRCKGPTSGQVSDGAAPEQVSSQEEPVRDLRMLKTEIRGRMSMAVLFCESKNLGTVSKRISKGMDT